MKLKKQKQKEKKAQKQKLALFLSTISVVALPIIVPGTVQAADLPRPCVAVSFPEANRTVSRACRRMDPFALTVVVAEMRPS